MGETVTLDRADFFPAAQFHIAETSIDGIGTAYAHNHNFYEIFLVESGRMDHRRNGNDEQMQSDCMALIFPDDVHCFKKKGTEPVRFVNLAFSREVYEAAYECCGSIYPDVGGCRLNRSLYLPHELASQLLGRIFWLQKESRPFSDAIKNEMLVTLIMDIITVSASGVGYAQTLPLWLKNACEEIKKPANLVIGMEKFVELSGKSQEHLTRTMRKYFDETPAGYINSVRLERAAEALSSPDRSILEVMLDVGFRNTSYFNKLFKEKYRMTPSRYRSGCISIIGKS